MDWQGEDMNKRIVKLIAASSVMLSTLAGCGSAATAAQTAAAGTASAAVTEKDGPKVEFITYEYGDYIKLLIDDTTKLLQDKGWQTDIINADSDLQKEISAFDNAQVNGADYIVFNDARNSTGLEDAIDSAHKAGIKVINLQPSYLDYVDAVVGCDDSQLGQITGEYIKEQVASQNIDMHMAVMVGMYAMGDQPRAEAMYKALGITKDSPEVAVEGEGKWAPDTAMALAEDWLQTYPDINVWWFYNDGMLLGAVQALSAANTDFDKTLVVSVDGLDSVKMIKEGTCDASAGRDRSGEAAKIIEVLNTWDQGGTIENKMNTVPGILITKDNVDQFE